MTYFWKITKLQRVKRNLWFHFRPGPEDPYGNGCGDVRDYLENIDWDQTPPGPDLPDEVVRNTAARYAEAERRLMATPRA